MPPITIYVSTYLNDIPLAVEVMADVFGVFAVHAARRGEPDQFQLTHIPTGAAFLHRVTWQQAVNAAKDINESGIDWVNVKGQKDLTEAHKAQGRALRKKYPEDPVVHRQRRG